MAVSLPVPCKNFLDLFFFYMTHQSMCLGLLEIITPVNRVKPRLQQKSRPLRVAQHKARCGESFLILCEHKVDILPTQVRESLDNTIRRHDRVVDEHGRLELRCIHHVLLDRQLRVHDERVHVHVPKVCCVGVLREGVAHRDDFCPGGRGVEEIVVADSRKESCVACMCCEINLC